MMSSEPVSQLSEPQLCFCFRDLVHGNLWGARVDEAWAGFCRARFRLREGRPGREEALRWHLDLVCSFFFFFMVGIAQTDRAVTVRVSWMG